MLPFLASAAIGAGLGALRNKKHRLQGALLGGGLGALGAVLAPWEWAALVLGWADLEAVWLQG
jgi:hypothetical protein